MPGGGLSYTDYIPVVIDLNIIAFLDGEEAVVGEDGEHGDAHAEVGGEELVTEEGFELVVVGAGVLDAGHKSLIALMLRPHWTPSRRAEKKVGSRYVSMASTRMFPDRRPRSCSSHSLA